MAQNKNETGKSYTNKNSESCDKKQSEGTSTVPYEDKSRPYGENKSK